MKKKYFGIPIVVLVLFAIVVGVAVAWYAFATISSNTSINESLSTANEAEFSTSIYPGQSATWTWKIENTAPVHYDLKADLILFSAPSGVSITDFQVGAGDETNDLTDDNSADFTIAGRSTLPCSLTVTAANDAATGSVKVGLTFSRQ